LASTSHQHQHPRPDRHGLPAANVVTFNTVDPAGLKAVYRMAQNGPEWLRKVNSFLNLQVLQMNADHGWCLQCWNTAYDSQTKGCNNNDRSSMSGATANLLGIAGVKSERIQRDGNRSAGCWVDDDIETLPAGWPIAVWLCAMLQMEGQSLGKPMVWCSSKRRLLRVARSSSQKDGTD
jgi:hypothetical protein